MKTKQKPTKKEGGITLIALIITIIVLVILAAVTLNSIFGNNIIGFATNGALNYAEEQQKELGMLNDVSDMLGEITGDADKPMTPTITLSGTKGNNDIYTSNVTVTISINKGIEQTGSIKLHYKINDGEEQITEEDVSLTIETEGITTIIVWAENEKGNLSDKYETSFTINKTAPSTPTISLNGTEGENGYYVSNVGVTISAGDTANVASIKYKVEGANPLSETESAGSNDLTFDITNDGTSTITAYIINTAGLTSDTMTQVVNKDETDPSTATIALSGETGETNINVSATGEDVTSGVASYAFQISTTENEDDFQTANTVVNETNSCTFNYEGLTSNTTYYLRVVVKDRAGNMLPSNVVNTTTKQSGLSEEVLASNVGKYVDYTPDVGSFSDHKNMSWNTTITTDTSVKWRILFAEGNKLTLISDKAVHNDFWLQGANGYNNGVLLLNNACKAMYSNNTLGAIGKSLNINHIEKVSSYTGASNEEYLLRSNGYYPNIFAQEEGGAPNGSYGTLGRSEQNSYVTGSSYSSGAVFKGKYTYYSYTISNSYMNQNYVDLFKSSPASWLASRCVTISSDSANFEIFYIDDRTISSYWLYNSSSDDETDRAGYAIRPIVEIDLTKVNVGVTGTGAENDGYSLTLK